MRERAELEAAIRRGGSVLINTPTGGRMVTKVEDLPSEADLARESGDERRAAAERLRLQGEIERLNQELGRLRGNPDAATVVPTDEAQPRPEAAGGTPDQMILPPPAAEPEKKTAKGKGDRE